MATLVSDWLRHFRLLLWNRWTEFNKTWQEARSQRPLTKLMFFVPIRKNKMAALASDWLRHFRLLLWNSWTEFNETWHETRSQCPLYSLCFLGRSEKQLGRPDLWMAATFSTSPLKPLNGIQRNLTGSKISISLPSLCFSGRSENKDGRPGWFLNKVAHWTQVQEMWPFGPLVTISTLEWNQGMAIISQEGFKELLSDRKALLGMLTFCFIAHLSRRLKWAIVIAHRPSSVCPSVVRPSSLNSHIFDFSSETAERNSTKLDRKQDLNALYQVCVFRADQKNKIAALDSDWLRHFRLLLWIRWTEFKRNLTGSKISTPSTKFVFFRPIGKARWPSRPLISWDIFDFSSETAERNSTKLDRKQGLSHLPSLCFPADRKNKMAALASDWLRHFRLLLWNRWTEFNEIDRKQDLKALYQVCVFRADRKNKMAALASDWLRHFRLFLWNRWTEFNETWQEASSQCLLPRLCFSGQSGKNKMAALASDWLRHLRLLWNRWKEFDETWLEARFQRPLPSLCFSGGSEKRNGRPGHWIEFNKTWQEARFQHPLPGLRFSGWSEKQGSRLSSDWLRHFRLLLWNHWMEFNETWQKASSQRLLPSLCFSGWSKKTRWLPWPVIGWDIFDFSSETPERNSMKLDRKQDLNVLYQTCVFWADWENKMAALASNWLRHFRLLLWNRWKEFNETWQEARSQCPLPSLCFSGRSKKQDGRLCLWLA